MKYTIAVGNPFEGMSFFGVFESALDAAEHAAEHFRTWSIMEINHVEPLPEFDQTR